MSESMSLERKLNAYVDIVFPFLVLFLPLGEVLPNGKLDLRESLLRTNDHICVLQARATRGPAFVF